MSTSTDLATRNVDAELPTTQPQAPPRLSDTLDVTQEERLRVADWHKEIKITRLFDESVRKLIARDRKYARAESSSMVTHSLIQAYIDILVAFLAARNPDFDCLPAETVADAGMEDAELYGKTMEIVVSKLLKSAKLKRIAERVVRSALSVGIGWFKVSWQEVYESDPQVQDELRDLRRLVQDTEAVRRDIGEGQAADMELAMVKLRERETALQEKAERLVAKGMAVGMVRPENMVVSVDAESVLDADDCDFMGDLFYVSLERAKGEFPRVPIDVLKAAATFTPREPGKIEKSSGLIVEMRDGDSDNYTPGTGKTELTSFLRGYEIWDAITGRYFVVLEGVTDRYATEPTKPLADTEQFFPYFGLSFTEVDGERQPQSLTQRTASLQDEIDRCLQSLVTHRKRVKPYLIFDARAISQATANRLNNGATGERIAVKTIGGKDTDLRRLFFPVQYNAIDMALYDISGYIRCMETQWGIQEALTSTVQVAKTATEADIQQAGTQAKTGHKRDKLEDVLSAIGAYTAQIASQRLSLPEVQRMAGPSALWLQVSTPDEMHEFVTCEVRAGSSGKPDTEAKRQAWSAQLSQIKEAMLMIGNLRQASNLEMADCMEEMLLETGDRLDLRIDMRRFIPQPPQAPIIGPDGQPMTNDGVQAAAAPPPGGGGSEVPTDPRSAQDQMAPTQTPAAIAG